MKPFYLHNIRVTPVVGIAFVLFLFGAGETFGQVGYNGNENTGFGGVLGPGEISISDDGTTVTMTFDKGGADFNDELVVYIDSESGGSESTSNFTDTGDDLRKAISGYNGSSRSVVTFPSGFKADYAVAADVAASNFAGLWGVVEGGSHSFIKDVNISPSDDVSSSSYEISFTFSDINTSSGSGSFKFVASYLNSNDVFRSDEAIGGGIASGNPGTGDVTFVSYYEYGSGDVGGDITTTQASGNWSNSSIWEGGSVPGSGSQVGVNHDLILDQNATVASLAISQGNAFAASDGNTRTLTVEGGGTLTNNGMFSGNDGKIATSGSGSVVVAGPATFNDVEASTGFNFGSENASVGGRFKINSGGFVDTNPPTYGSSATLVYAAGTNYGRSLEWSSASEEGYPNNVTIQNSTTLDLSTNGGASTARKMAGTLTVKSGSVLDMDDMSAALTVEGDVAVDNKLTLGSNSGGSMDVNGSSVTVADGATIELQNNELQLGTSATLQENGTGRVTDGPDNSGGTITATRTLSNPTTENVAGLGAVLTASADLGSVDIARGHEAQSGNGNQSIERYYDIEPGQNNSGLDATLTLNYADAELNGIAEGDLIFFKSEDGGSTWSKEEFDSRNNTTNGGEVTLNGIQSFSRWTLGDSNNPLPVELASFDASASGQGAVLSWKTTSEINNSGFAVQHAVGDGAFEKAGWVDGAGTTTEGQDYRFSLEDLSAGTHRFRLKQVDLDGTASVSETVSLTVQPEGAVAVTTAPHPVQQTSTVRLTATESGPVTVALYDVLGRRVKTMHEGRVTANQPETFSVDASALAAGTYILRVQGESFTQTERITVDR